MKDKITCFLPCRLGSQRVPRKNIKPFAGHEFGLIQVKLKQLISANLIDEIVLSTNDESIIEYASALRVEKLKIHRREEELSSSSTSTDSLVSHAASLVSSGNILWTHVTSPFITAKLYDKIINAYFDAKKQGFDSLMTTTKIHGFLWKDSQPFNYNRDLEKWPRTQTIEPLHDVNSAVFLTSLSVYEKKADRIGDTPYLYALDKLVSHDIDWPEDFAIAECMAEKRLVDL